MAAAGGIVARKLKIKVAPKPVGIDSSRSSCGTKLYSADKLKANLSTRGSHKHGLITVADNRKEKRLKLDRSVTQQFSGILKELMSHPAGWVFNQPVDPVKLNIPDYFSIISEPMDLGTIKKKLEKNLYFGIEEFDADVRLTFSNAMLYNPPGNPVHEMAKELNDIFSTRWKLWEAKWKCKITNVKQVHVSSGKAKYAYDSRQNKRSPLHNGLLPKMFSSSEGKQKLTEKLGEESKGKMPPNLQDSHKQDFVCQKEENSALKTLNARAVKAEHAKMTEKAGHQSLKKIATKGTDSGNRGASGSPISKQSLNLAVSKCGSCGSVRCQCIFNNESGHASSDLSSERSPVQDNRNACKMDCEAKHSTASQMSRSDPDHDGAVSSLDEEHTCSSLLPSVSLTTASGEGWYPHSDVQQSLKKALHDVMLKSRFADTILKAQQRMLLDHGGKADIVKMQQEKERLEKLQREEKARLEARIRAAESASRMRAEAEQKMQREREREAARLALQKMEKTVEFDNNLEILKDLEMLSDCSPSIHFPDSEDGSEMVEGLIKDKDGHFCRLLERLGLYLKDDDYTAEEDEVALLNGDTEEGELS